jgi:hypothetical protein
MSQGPEKKDRQAPGFCPFPRRFWKKSTFGKLELDFQAFSKKYVYNSNTLGRSEKIVLYMLNAISFTGSTFLHAALIV